MQHIASGPSPQPDFTISVSPSLRVAVSPSQRVAIPPSPRGLISLARLVLSLIGVARRTTAWQNSAKPLTSPTFSLMRNKSNWSATMQTANAREQMIEQQVRAWDVLDARVLEIGRAHV